MIDKELEAMVKCHEYLEDLDSESKMRVIRYLLDRYNFLPAGDRLLHDTSETLMAIEESGEIDDVSNAQKPKNLKKNNKSKAKGKKASLNQNYSIVQDLNLVPSNEESLKDFYSQFNPKNNFDNNIIILYYLQKKLGIENINTDHIYTCYKHLSLKVPNIRQSLVDTKNRKGWIDTSNSDDLKVNVHGENYIEHEIPRSGN